MRGVNLGNWLVLEKWMSPRLFDGTTADDETTLCRQLDDITKRERYKVHRDEFVTDRDFAHLAGLGLDLLRLPVPYFVFGGVEPYVGCIEYVDQAFRWAEKYDLKILVDLHTVPDSQNGFDNGGLQGVCKFHLDDANVELALDVLGRLAERYRTSPALWGIEVLNEPVSPALWEMINVPVHFKPADPEYAKGSEAVPTEFLKRYYRQAYDRIRAAAPDVRVVFHDGFRIDEWVGFVTEPDFTNVVVDTHMYLLPFALETRNRSPEEFLTHVEDSFAATLRETTRHFPVMVGEWSLEAPSPKVAELPADEQRAFYRSLAEAQLKAWEHATAWTFWSLKTLIDTPVGDIWDLPKAVDLGLLPLEGASR
jgi:glucan 1,3-beta-glucosidase